MVIYVWTLGLEIYVLKLTVLMINWQLLKLYVLLSYQLASTTINLNFPCGTPFPNKNDKIKLKIFFNVDPIPT